MGSHPQPSRTVWQLTANGILEFGRGSSLEENKGPHVDKGLQDFTTPEEEIIGNLGKEGERGRKEGRRKKEGERNSDISTPFPCFLLYV